MTNTPTGCCSDLRPILGIFKNISESRSVNNAFQQLDLDPNSRQKQKTQTAEALPRCGHEII